MNLEEIGEFGLIKRLTKGITLDAPEVFAGIGDDAAVIRAGRDKFTLFTMDTLIESIHFTLDALTPYQLGWKMLAVNLSDIAAMGGIPKYALISLGLRSQTSVKFVDGLYRGIKALAGKYRVSIIGGDTVRVPHQLTFTIALLGEVERKELTLRSGARIGDNILVTGDLGAATAHRLQGRHLPPRPRLEEARTIVKKFSPTSMIDLSDGLASDLRRICEASRVGAEIWSGKIPISRRTRHIARELGQDPLSLALEGGEDYELLFTLPSLCPFPPGGERRVRGNSRRANSGLKFPVSLIGKITERKEEISLVDENGSLRPLKTKGYEHFAAGISAIKGDQGRPYAHPKGHK